MRGELIIGNLSPAGVRLTGGYPADPKARFTRSPGAVGSGYADVDAAIAEPVRLMNEALGFTTYASCEGHLDPVNPHVPIPVDSEALSRIEPCVSYIGFYLRADEHVALVGFLCDHGFQSAYSGYFARGRATGRSLPRNYVRYSGEAVLSFHLSERVNGDMATARASVEPRDMPLGQAEWDRLRDSAWETWLDLFELYRGRTA